MRLLKILTFFAASVVLSSQIALACQPGPPPAGYLNTEITEINKYAPRGIEVKFSIENKYPFDMCRLDDLPFTFDISANYMQVDIRNRYLKFEQIKAEDYVPERIPALTKVEAIYRFQCPSRFTHVAKYEETINTNRILKAGEDISIYCLADEPLITNEEANLLPGEVIDLKVRVDLSFRACFGKKRNLDNHIYVSQNIENKIEKYEVNQYLPIRAKVTPEFELISLNPPQDDQQ